MPQFTPSSVHSATVTFSNPKSAGFDYKASLCMGAAWTEMASASFHLDAKQSKSIVFSVTMPSIPGTYPVYFKVTCGGVLIGTFVATEAIVISQIDVLRPGLFPTIGIVAVDNVPLVFRYSEDLVYLEYFLKEPIEMSRLRGVTLEWQTTEWPFPTRDSSGEYEMIGVWFRASYYRSDFKIDDPYRFGPIFYGETLKPFSTRNKTAVLALQYEGYYRPGMYYLVFDWGYIWKNIAGELASSGLQTFRILDAVYCTSSGHVP